MPSERHETALVTVAGGRGAPTSNLWPCWVMYLEEARKKNIKNGEKVLNSSCWVQSQSALLLSVTPEFNQAYLSSFCKELWPLKKAELHNDGELLSLIIAQSPNLQQFEKQQTIKIQE